MQTYDIKKIHRDLYVPKAGRIELVDVPEFGYLCVDGEGDPNTSDDYRAAVEALYTVSYAIRFAAKHELDRVHVVAPLEGLWSAHDHTVFTDRAKDQWQWTMMIHQPDHITAEMVDAALTATAKKKPNPALDLVRLERRAEGLSVQALHVGSYDDEAPLIARMHAHAAEHG
ncbi:MAG TPA: GyrI-like domain-containing protein, partial [Terrimesophilobacter sp.]|nr:GyrI-like domain-containing protein [Terrimesophilobacter sp.]